MNETKELIAELRNGCVLHPKRWSGDTHDDIGGSIREEATDELMRRAADALESMERDAWQTIETAPKDGTRIFLGGEGWISSASWDPPQGKWWRFYDEHGDDDYLDESPTHWRPLPLPPAMKGEDNE